MLTTLAPTESQDKMGNETFTTNIPDLTTQTPPTTTKSVTTTMKVKPTRPKPTGKPTTRWPTKKTTQAPPTTTAGMTTDAVLTETNPPPASPDVMNNTKPNTTTTADTTTETTPSTSPVTSTTPAAPTTKPLPKTTREVAATTEEVKTTLEGESVPTEEILTETGTTDMSVVTLVGQELPALQSMNMVFQLHNAENEQSDANNVEESKTELPGESAFEFVSISSNEITTRDVFTDDDLTSTMAFTTMFADPTLGEDLVFLTTPSDDEVLPTKGMSMLEAIILMDENKGQLQDLSNVYPFNKRSTQSSIDEVPTSMYQENDSPLTTLMSIINKSNQTNDQVTPQTSGEESIATYVNSHLFDNDVSTNNYFTESMDSTSSEMKHLDSTTEILTKDTEDLVTGSGFPTLEPDTIIFPTARLPRAIKG